MAGPLDASVVICTHNPRPEYLARVLDALRAQTLPADRWELLLVDNASREPLAARHDLSWHPHARHVREDELGLTPARLRGVAESRADLLVFVDDDNVLAPDYLAEGLGVAARWPALGTWGGQCVPEFECPPPAHLTPHLADLALRTVDRDYWTNLPGWSDAYPFGAGMCVRRPVAERHFREVVASPVRMSLDRAGGRLMSGGDYDLNWNCCRMGSGCGVFRALRLTHLIPAARLTDDYFIRLIWGHEYSGTMLQCLYGRPPGRPLSAAGRTRDWLRARWLPRFERRVRVARVDGRRQAVADWRAATAGSDGVSP